MDIKKSALILFAAAALLLPLHALSQQSQDPKKTQGQSPSQAQSHGGDTMGGMDMGDMHDGAKDSAAEQSANDSMSGHHMDMGAHMFMTELRAENPTDDKRAEQIVETLRPAIAKYKDYKVALADGFKIFGPNVPQEHYHFTNYTYAFEASFGFNAEHPTSLLYKKTSDGYELEGAMYTAPKRASLEQLNELVPLSVARWHKHVNLCWPPNAAHWQEANWKEFGLRGSIATEDACNAAGGRWIPQIFGWMVHVYPYETDPAKIWAH
jgi:hypothetical protein